MKKLLTKENAFFVGHRGNLQKQWSLWSNALPYVKPYYAVKCNNNSILMGNLAHLGSGFDCASLREVKEVRALPSGKNPIVFAHPCKINKEIVEVQDLDVSTTVVDSPEEVAKVKAHGWKGTVLVRLLVDDKGSKQPFGAKFGAPAAWWTDICKELIRNEVVCSGFSFHVGSECQEPLNYYNAIKTGSAFTNLLHTYQKQRIQTIDIGGGFLGSEQNLHDCARQITKAKYEFFNPGVQPITWIAEPGRYFASSFLSLYVPIIGKKKRLDGKGWRYTINESIYGSFSNIPFDHQKPVPIPLKSYGKNAPLYPAEIYGRTCDSGDCLGKDYMLPELDEGDWLLFRDMGAYTTVTASEFNGFPKPELYME